ncbi:MAG TPA: hypothetical protein VFE54_02575 [Mucilaginibacter sp.]|jgi:hypothetical protein|nr:hypothetical protein [Mucilaginibacter sp.]
MKTNFLFVLLAILVFTSSCKKQNVTPLGPLNITQHGQLVAKWNIAKDSTASQFTTTLVNSHVYIGSADDYYDFRADGKCYIHENGAFDTLTFKIVTDTTVAFNAQYPSLINPLTSHSARISFAEPQGPGGGFYSKTVFLTK